MAAHPAQCFGRLHAQFPSLCGDEVGNLVALELASDPGEHENMANRGPEPVSELKIKLEK
jgi:hypothetical protein